MSLVIPLVGWAFGSTSAAAPSRPEVDVIELTGRIDRIEADFLRRSLADAKKTGSSLLVIRIDSRGTLLSDNELDELVSAIARPPVPVGVWVGPNGAVAYGGAVELVKAAPIVGVAPGARVGRSLPRHDPKREFSGSLDSGAAARVGLAELTSPTLGAFVNDLSGREIAGTHVELPTRVVTVGGTSQRQPEYDVTFAKPGLIARLLHTTGSPAVAYLLVVVGLMLVVFEFFTIGVGIAAVCGAGALVLGAYGLAMLPTRIPALIALVVAIFGYAIDVQTGIPRAWTVIGTVALLMGSLFLYHGLSVGIVPLLAGIIGVPLFMIGAMATVVRSRFSTRTIGRSSMIGEEGTALGAVNPEGTVRVRGGLWRARTNRAVPIAGGAPIRVVSIDGLLLEVERLSPEAPVDPDSGDAARES